MKETRKGKELIEEKGTKSRKEFGKSWERTGKELGKSWERAEEGIRQKYEHLAGTGK